MRIEPPAYYTRLAPFRALFGQGNPILTYHKLGPKPSQARLKGLYVSAHLFARQLKELAREGYASGSLDKWNSEPSKQIILTFDDGYVNVLEHGLGVLADAGFKAIQFLPVNFLGKINEWDAAEGEAPEKIMDTGQVREWIADGHEVGSHSLNHPFLTKLSTEQAKEEINASRKKLQDLFGKEVKHFCYPYGDWNESVRDLVQEAGYKTACTTDHGMNVDGNSPFSLKRFTARYASRKLRNLWFWIKEAACS